ncbi:MAG: fibronectin type III domain-containing protein [Acidobacteriota bacterium]
MTKTHWSRLGVAVAILLLAAPLAAVRHPDSTPLHELSYSSPDLYIGTGYISGADLAAQGQTAAVDALQALGVSPQGAYLDPRSGRWGTLMPATPLLPGNATTLAWSDVAAAAPRDNSELEGIAWDAFYGWLSANAGPLGLDMSEVAAPAKVAAQRNGQLIHIYVPRKVGGLTVRESFLTAVINHGNLVLFGAVKWGDVATPRLPQFDTAAARQTVDQHLGSLAGQLEWTKQELVYVPVAKGADPLRVSVGDGYGYRLVWSFRGSQPGDAALWEAMVDANDNSLLGFVDRTHYASTREVVGGVYPVSNDGVPPDGVNISFGMPFADIANGGNDLFTDRGGNLAACVDGSIETTLQGRYVIMDDQCGAISESTTGDVLDLGTSGGTDCTVPPGASAGNTHSSRSGFFELNRAMSISRSYIPDNTFFNGELTAIMNINQFCNATSGGPTVRFYRQGGGCANTGEIAGVFDHEFGHSIDFADVNPAVSSPGEGIADIYAAQFLHTSCIGRNFRLGNNCGGYGDPCTSCDGVRDIDWANRASNTPHDLAWIDANCGSGGGTPCGGSTHCEGAVYAEAVWDLWQRKLSAAPYNFDSRRSAELTSLLTWGGAINVGNWYNCTDGTGVGDGCNADGGYLNYLAADDDDGNLMNGTPHMGAIFSAFDDHGIACPTPAVADSGCANTPTTAPTLVATPIDRGMNLTWNAVADATTYRVFRTEGVFGCDFGKEIIAEVTGTSFVDTGLSNGSDYHYTVIPVGPSASCYGPASSCVTAAPAGGANLGLPGLPPQIVIQSGDGDDFVDSCEAVTVNFAVDNIGSVTAFNVRVDDVRSPSHPHLDAAITFPAQVSASMAPCDQATGSFDFLAFDVDFNDVITFEVDVTSNQMAGIVTTQTYQIGFIESDLQAVASQTYTFEADEEGWLVADGTFDRTDAFGGGDGTSFAFASSNGVDSVCDKIRSPGFIPSASTTMTMWTELNMETGNWDRANVAIVDGSGTRTVVAPDGGRTYNTTGNPDFAACNDGEDGWGAVLNTWASSSFSAGALGSSGIAGELVQVEMTHGTDVAVVGTGFRFDQVTLTNIEVQVEDAQPNCATPILFGDDFELGNLSRWSNTVP